jgi:hypothetical protein
MGEHVHDLKGALRAANRSLEAANVDGRPDETPKHIAEAVRQLTFILRELQALRSARLDGNFPPVSLNKSALDRPKEYRAQPTQPTTPDCSPQNKKILAGPKRAVQAITPD